MTSTVTDPTRLMSVADVAVQLGCSRGHVHNLIRAGHFTPVDIAATGGRPKTRIPTGEVERFIANRTG